MSPILDQASAVLKDTIQVVKIDTEKYPSIADKYRIEALPTFIIFKDGKPYDRFVSSFSIFKLLWKKIILHLQDDILEMHSERDRLKKGQGLPYLLLHLQWILDAFNELIFRQSTLLEITTPRQQGQ